MSVPSELGKCMLPGCNKNKYQDPSNGRIHDYCCRSHGFKANQEGKYFIKLGPQTIAIGNA